MTEDQAFCLWHGYFPNKYDRCPSCKASLPANVYIKL